MISIVDYGIGNVGSVANMLKHVGAPVHLAFTRDEVASAKALLLPGVGHFGHAMSMLHSLGLVDVIRHKVLAERTPILGICLGMQLLGTHSEEGDAAGLDLIPARFTKIVPDEGSELKVPHMGWNLVSVKRPNPILAYEGEQRFYFVHSYKAECDRPQDVLGTTVHGAEFCCAYGRDNVYGVQFHPEKSHRFGMELFRRFVEFAC
ncbi:imidazole glycerol phosphate synthase subunit HisH [Brevundimonas halotolerans]|uniref:Imidazole glycerol phosphate synthase subunit HisH n=1 Tax=Brevundimonas halotolerans TaxID=69670 RepID=A0A7W9A568_9CAUL|nr:imidazole glycerol phosphate synthase subunit HisH [Brevundimonas halotolerans]MBB5661408.1 glutamine amidotransferase [Brevundimonas halotolerans]